MLAFVLICFVPLAGARGQVAAGSLSGTIVDVTGGVLPGADVTLLSMIAETDAAGRFVFAEVLPGTYTLRVQKAGFRTQDFQVRVQGGTIIHLGRIPMQFDVPLCLGSLESRTIRRRKIHSGAKPVLSGTLLEGKAPLQSLTVTLHAHGGWAPTKTTLTDDHGKFEFHDLAPGEYDLQVSSRGTDALRNLALHIDRDRNLQIRLAWTPQLCL